MNAKNLKLTLNGRPITPIPCESIGDDPMLAALDIAQYLAHRYDTIAALLADPVAVRDEVTRLASLFSSRTGKPLPRIAMVWDLATGTMDLEIGPPRGWPRAVDTAPQP